MTVRAIGMNDFLYNELEEPSVCDLMEEVQIQSEVGVWNPDKSALLSLM